MRDIILSFKLPRKVVGVRRTLCLTREANTAATKEYPNILNSAHEAAMRGAMWSFESDDDQVHKIASLLAGFALTTAKSKDSARKGNAFNGRISLPFLDGPPPPPCTTRMAWIAESNDWVLYTADKLAHPKVRCRKAGYDGFCQCLLMLLKR